MGFDSTRKAGGFDHGAECRAACRHFDSDGASRLGLALFFAVDHEAVRWRSPVGEVPSRLHIYCAFSRQIQAIFANYPPLIEPLSLDEAYLRQDVRGCERNRPLRRAHTANRGRSLECRVRLSRIIGPSPIRSEFVSSRQFQTATMVWPGSESASELLEEASKSVEINHARPHCT